MLPENLVLTIMSTSITGAGLVLAIYALIRPITQILEKRAESYKQSVTDLKEKSKSLGKRTDKELDEMKTIVDEIKEKKTPPYYTGLGILLPFLGYIASALFACLWVLDWNKLIIDFGLPWLWGLSTFIFLMVGIVVIGDIYEVTKHEYDRLLRTKEARN